MIRKSSLSTKFFWITLFSIAMGLLETVVVIYLREIYYPDGFAFPLRPIAPNLIVAELFRELATMVMLLSIGFIASEKAPARFAWFIFSFAVWDIFYYVFLKLFLGWPESLLTWDVLFLIPTTWVGPVIGPVINACTMILLAVFLLLPNRDGKLLSLNKQEWLLLIVGSVVVIISYTEEYARFILQKFSFNEVLSFSVSEDVQAHALHFVPQYFNWWIYGFGELLMFLAIFLYIRRKNL